MSPTPTPKTTVTTIGEVSWGRFEVTVCAACNQVIGPDNRCACDTLSVPPLDSEELPS